MVHVSEVLSGLACNCRCAECGKLLIAKKGKHLAHHFAHDASASCHNAPETALHRLAKQIIKEHLSIHLPEVKASHGDQSRFIHPAQHRKFDRATPEAGHLNKVVPDLFVELENRKLLIEIFVTHPCDDVKVTELRRQGIATVEINLSKTARDSSRDEVERAVLSEAHRSWVYHPKIDEAIMEMKIAEEKEEERQRLQFEKKVADFSDEYAKGIKELELHDTLAFDQAYMTFRVGLGDHIGIEVGGAGCFTVSPYGWQFLIMETAFIPSEGRKSSHKVKDLLDFLKQNQFVRNKFQYLPSNIEQSLESNGIGFLSPYHAIEAYLDVLVDQGILYKTMQKYILAPDLISKISALRAKDDMRSSRHRDVLGRAEKILSFLPDTERGRMTASDWLCIPQECGISFQNAIENDDERFDRMLRILIKIETMLFNKGEFVEVTLGLPIEAEVLRQREHRKAEETAREAIRLEQAHKAQEDRVGKLITAAAKLGAEGLAWVETANPRLDGKSPKDKALYGDAGLSEAQWELKIELQRRYEREQRDQVISMYRSELEREATEILGDASRPFLSSPYPELGNKRPRDYCVDKPTLQQRLDLAKKVNARRR